jgi:hypothetical protein
VSDVDPRMMAAGPPEAEGAVRLIFEYEGDEVRLVSSQPVDVVVQAGDAVRGMEDRSGFWVELRSQAEDVLYRRVLTDPARVHPEVFSPDPEVGITRASEPQPAGAFTVLLPSRPEASHVVLMASPSAGGTRAPRLAASQDAPAEEIARFPISGGTGS